VNANADGDRCRFSWAGRACIEPGSRWQNAYAEDFGGARDDLLAVEPFLASPTPKC
jgi:hypothetical protein